MTISYYNGVKDRTGIRVNIMKVLERIRLGFYAGKVELARVNPAEKMALPAACFSGNFEVDKRNDSGLLEYTGIVVLDIDEKDYQKVMMAKAMLIDDPYVFAFFESPNRGLKALFKVQTPAELHRDVAFPQLKEYFEDNYGLDVDNSGKNISRLCFVSSDPEMYINDDPLVFNVDESYRPARFYKDTAIPEFQNYEPSNNLTFIYNKCVEWTDKNITFVKGDRNNYIYQLACKLNRAGVNLADAKAMILNKLNPNMPFSELNATINGVYNRHSNEYGSRMIYEKKQDGTTLF